MIMDDGASEYQVTSVLVRPDLDELKEQAMAGKPPDLEPVGQCPYCHHDLMKREVKLPLRWATQPIPGINTPAPTLLTYWACMNEECSLMFWQHPRTSRWTPPIVDDLLEH
jgi:hypothetical protein